MRRCGPTVPGLPHFAVLLRRRLPLLRELMWYKPLAARVPKNTCQLLGDSGSALGNEVSMTCVLPYRRL